MQEWEYHPPPDIDATMTESLRNFPREPQMLIYSIRSLAAMLLRGWMRLYHRLKIDGQEHLPDRVSTLCLLSSVPLKKIHRTFPAAAADYFFSSLPRSAVSAILINALPFDRKLKGAESLAVCSKLLDNEGNVLIIFPEGTRTTSGEMGRFRSGIGRLVVGRNLAVLPCHLAGGVNAWPKGKAFPRPHQLRLRIGTARTYAHLAKTSESVGEICRDLQESVAELGRLDA